MTTETIYMTVKQAGKAWDETEQQYLGIMSWHKAVIIAKQQANEVRLCNTKGYNNQGHYIQPNK